MCAQGRRAAAPFRGAAGAWYRRAPIVSEVATKSTRHPAQMLREKEPDTPWVVLAWSFEQPELAGAAGPLTGPRLVGRGDEEPGDPAPRLELCAPRPLDMKPIAPLAGATLSRRQLLLAPMAGGAVTVQSIGRCPMLLRGEAAESGLLAPGDTLVLQDVLALLVVHRPRYWLPIPRYADLGFPFGAADPGGIVGESLAAWDLRDEIAFAARSGQHVLVHGESGTGKELAARALHALSPRHRGPFVARNAATLPEGLVDAELFGNARGYPHAQSPERPGLIGQAHGGTLFLDEIGELRHDLQAHLLRVLDRGGEYQRLGDARTHRSDFRLVAATNRPVEALKHDLCARFTMRVRVPGLGERRDDIPLLIRHLLAAAAHHQPAVAGRFFEKDGRRLPAPNVEPALVEALLRHEYTLHLRELSRLLWIALTSSRDGVLRLTPSLVAELRLRPPPAPGAAVQPPAPEVPVREPTPEVPVRAPAPEEPVLEPAPGVPVREIAPEVPVLEPAPGAPVRDTLPGAPVREIAPEVPVVERAPEVPAPEAAEGAGAPGELAPAPGGAGEMGEAREAGEAMEAGEASDPGERERIEAALAKARKKVAPAARLLGLSRYALYRLMAKHGIRAPGGEDTGSGE